MLEYVAHVKRNEQGDWAQPHILETHLRKTAEHASGFAGEIGADIAHLAGLWHDLGKYRKKFQEYIRIQSGYQAEDAHIENGKRAPHSTAGAIHAVKQLPSGIGHIIAYLIAGHHAGLPDFFGGKGSLEFRTTDGLEEYNQALSEDIPENILYASCGLPPDFARDPRTIAIWMRMLFSCLVDADFIDTERYMQPERTEVRSPNMSLMELEKCFNESLSNMRAQAEISELNLIRDGIYRSCLKAAGLKPGLFSLTVPTGGGKTLSSLAFALQHAKKYNKHRIIYAIPYTSIIEQNADVFRRFLGDEAVLEHHSSLDVSPTKENLRNRLAAENWDAPLIVTTNVQLFESLHASRTSRCRKLHNIANSIVILDEAQQLPRDFHAPITQSMQQLSDHFGVTWVLCTATQPALGKVKDNFGQIQLEGLSNVREIIDDPLQLAQQLKRVEVRMPEQGAGKISWPDLCATILQHECCLTIVNTRRQARRLAELIGDDECCVHLSANMCAAHRSQVISEIKERLDEWRQGSGSPMRVISTQLIEAGVDVDFPVVYRAMAGLDSIAQAAGRCNREGKMPQPGQVFVFYPEEASPPGFLRQGEDTTIALLNSGQLTEPLSPDSFKAYFDLLNAKGDRDKHGIIDLLIAKQSNDTPLAIQFREAAKRFRLIDDAGESVIVPYVPQGEDKSPVDGWLNMLEKDASQKWLYRKLQRYTITISEQQLNKFRGLGCIDQRAGLNVMLESFYHKRWGADCFDPIIPPDRSVI